MKYVKFGLCMDVSGHTIRKHNRRVGSGCVDEYRRGAFGSYFVVYRVVIIFIFHANMMETF